MTNDFLYEAEFIINGSEVKILTWIPSVPHRGDNVIANGEKYTVYKLEYEYSVGKNKVKIYME